MPIIPSPASFVPTRVLPLLQLVLACLACTALCGTARSEEATLQTFSAGGNTILTFAPVEAVSELPPIDGKPLVTISASQLRMSQATAPDDMETGTVYDDEEEFDALKMEKRKAYKLHKGLREHGVSVGYGARFPWLDGRTYDQMFQVIPTWGRFRNSTQEFLWEVPLTVFTEPETAFLAGLNLTFRQHLTSNRKLAPYVEFGTGINLTDLNIRELNGAFQFTLQGGAGIRASIGETKDLTLSARWYHLSNADTQLPNIGLNNYLILLGYTQLY